VAPGAGHPQEAYLDFWLSKLVSVSVLKRPETIVLKRPETTNVATLVWLFSPAWDAVELTLEVVFICPFVVIDPTD
jgi:hypothetical protein